MNRKIYYWKLRTTELQLGERTLIMGVLNVTPDSFSDAGRFSDPDRAYARAIEMEEQGVDIIDIGAESTRPDSKRISADEEWQRLLPVLKRLRDKLRVPLSLDTYKSEVAERALQYGVEILNDPSGLTFDADLAKVAVNGDAGLILNHMRGLPETWAKLPPMPDVIGTIAKDLEATTSRARRAGVEKNRIMVDPGLGFGKRKEQNSDILAHLGRLATLDYPILVGPSRKSFLAQAAEGDTIHANAAAVAAAILNGAHMVRVHDVKEMRIVAQVADEIARAGIARSVQEESERPVVRPRRQPVTMFEDERAKPARPPLAKPEPRPEPVRPAAAAIEKKPVEDRPVLRPRQDKPSKGWTEDRPAARRPAADRPPRRPASDRPPQSRPSQDRPSRGPWQDRPSRAPQDRPQRGSSDRPARGPQDRPFRGPRNDRPDRPARPERGSSSDRPPRRSPGGPPSQDRPPRGPLNNGPKDGPPRRPFRKRP